MKGRLLYRHFASQTAARVAIQQYNRSNRAIWVASGLALGAYSLNGRRVEAKSAEAAENVTSSSDEPVKNPKFKQRKLREYENKIRQYSNPDKIFRYFATV